jgi:hypothetical protein
MFRGFFTLAGAKKVVESAILAIFSCNKAIAARLGCGAWRRGFDATNGCYACGRSRGNGVGRCARRLGVLGLSGSAGRLGRGPGTCALRRDDGASRGGAAWRGRADPPLQGRNAVGRRTGPRGTDRRGARRAGRTRADRGCSAAGAGRTTRRGNAAIIRNGTCGTQSGCAVARGDRRAATAGDHPAFTARGRAASRHAASRHTASRRHAGRAGEIRRAGKNGRRTAGACDCTGVAARKSRTAAARESRAFASTGERGYCPAGRGRASARGAACGTANRATRIRAGLDAANRRASGCRRGAAGCVGERRNRSACLGIAAGHAQPRRKPETRNAAATRGASPVQRRAGQAGERSADHRDARPGGPLRAIGADRAGLRSAGHPGDAPIALRAPRPADSLHSGLGRIASIFHLRRVSARGKTPICRA